MNQTGKTLLLLTAVGFSFSVQALTPDNRYDTIIDRNIFRLNPTPVVAPTNTEPAPLDKDIQLSGISNHGGEKKAWFVVKQAKPGPKDLPQYMSLAEGERQEFLEVVTILEEEGEVKILNAGNSMILSLKNNSLKPMPVSPMPATPAPIANIPPPQPAATAVYGGNTASFGGSAVTVTGGTPMTTTGQQTDSAGLRSIPTRQIRMTPATPQAAAPAEKPIDPLTQRVLMEVQQAEAQSKGIALPPLPPLP